MRSYTHKAKLQGKPFPIGLNLEAVALADGAVGAGWALFRAMLKAKASHVCVDNGIALLANKKAFVVGNLVSDWAIAENSTLFLPLDDRVVYLAELTSVGEETAIVDGSERVVALDVAKAEAASPDRGLLLVNETAAYHELADLGLEEIDRPIAPNTRYFALGAMRAFAVARLLHPGHVLFVLLALIAAVLSIQVATHEPDIVQVLQSREAGGERRLASDLRRAATEERALLALRGHGLSKASLDQFQVKAEGSFDPRSFDRLQAFAKGRSGHLVVQAGGWEIYWNIDQSTTFAELELLPVNEAMSEFFGAFREVAATPIIEGYTDGGTDLLANGWRIIRNYRGVMFSLRIDGGYSKLQVLAHAIEQTPVAAQLSEIEWSFNNGALERVDLKMKVRGRDD